MTVSRRRAAVALAVAAGLAVPALQTAAAGRSAAPAAPAPSYAPHCPWLRGHASPNRRAHELVSAMSLRQKIGMVSGQPPAQQTETNSGAAGVIAAIPSLCVPALVLNDASAGIGDEQVNTTAFPDSIALTAAWDRGLARRYGRVLGREAFVKGVNVLLGPGMDIARNPLNGRNFEYAGEDPYLAGQAAASIIRGVQSQHVVATAKHYALNDQEIHRTSDSSDASRRTMHEIHLPAFEAAVRQGHAGAVMCAYNRINGRYACQNRYTLRRVLDHQFHFRGWVMSDWGATHSTVASAKSGLDMEMPTGTHYGAALMSAVRKHDVAMHTMNDMVLRIVRPMFRFGLFTHVPAEGTRATAANATTARSLRMARRVGESGTVLLQDRKRVLPIRGSGRSIALIGPAAGPVGAEDAYQGYGSGHVSQFGDVPTVVSPLQAISGRAAQNGDVVTYTNGGTTVDAVAAARASDLAVVFVSDAEIEGADRPNYNAHAGRCSFVLFTSPTGCNYDSINQNRLVTAVAKANPHTVVVVQSGDPIAMPWQHRVQAIVDNWYPGQEDGRTIAPVLFGDVDPSGKLPVTVPRRLSDDPLRSKRQYPGVPDAKGIPQSHYSEGLLVGYRWYDARHIRPRFPFGFGLSYTSFRFSHLSVARTGSGARVTVTVTNTGKRAGAEVAQVYVGQPAATHEPPRQLAAFRRVVLKPGRSCRVRLRLQPRAFEHWSTSSDRFLRAPGGYRVLVGDSSAHLPLHAAVRF